MQPPCALFTVDSFPLSHVALNEDVQFHFIMPSAVLTPKQLNQHFGPHIQQSLIFLVRSGPNVIKLFLSANYGFFSKLECYSLVGISSLV